MKNKITKYQLNINDKKPFSLEDQLIYFEVSDQCRESPFILDIKNGLATYCHHNPVVHEDPFFYSVIWGSPIIEDKIDHLSAIHVINSRSCLDDISLIDGQFLAITLNKKSSKVDVITDRFNSINIFYAFVDNKLICSSSYYFLAKKLKRLNSFEWKPELMYEFLRLNRVFGTETYDKESKFLTPASVLTFKTNKISVNRYWNPSFYKKKYGSIKKVFNRYFHLLRQSTSILTNDKKFKNNFLFLSGGHDSRSVLSVADKNIKCLTASYSDNLEVEIARRCAFSTNNDFIFCQLPQDHLIYYFDETIKITSGFHSFIDSFFIGFSKDIVGERALALNGHGLDYFFQGSYLPSKWFVLFNKPLFIKVLRQSNLPFAVDFVNNVPYRVKGVDINTLIKPKFRNEILDKLLRRINCITERYKDANLSNEEKWDLLTIDTLGRHYSRPNIDSMNLLCHIRIPSFNNQLFNFFLSLPIKYRLNAALPRLLLKQSILGSIPTSNYGFPASDHFLLKTFKQLSKKVIRSITNINSLRCPVSTDRTFPDQNNFLRQSLHLQKLIKETFSHSSVRKNLHCLDWDRVNLVFKETINGKAKGAQFLFALLTLGRFIILLESEE